MSGGQAFLQELHEFLRFLRSLWGALAGISVLFPLSNVFLAVVPIADGGRPFQSLSPAVVTTVTMLTCVFLTFATFARRDQFTRAERHDRHTRSARASFAGALGALAVYVLAPNGLYRELITESEGEAGIAVCGGLFAALYIATFALLTRAFLILAMIVFHRDRGDAPA